MTRLLPVAEPARARAYVRVALRAHRPLAVGCAAVLVGATAAGLAVPPLLGTLVDAALARDAGRIDLLVGLLLVSVIAVAALDGLATTLVAKLGERMLADLREAVLARALTVPIAQVEAAGTGDLLARVGPDVDAISQAFREAVPTLLLSGLAVALTGVGLFALDPWFVLAAAAATPLHFAAARSYLRRSRPLFAAERIAISARTQHLHDALTGARTIRARGETAAAHDAVAGASAESVHRSIRAARAGADYGGKLNVAELLALGGVLAAGFILVRADEVTVGAATAAALYVHRLFSPVMELLGLIDTLQDATASLSRLVGVAELPAPAPGAGVTADGYRLELEHVRFAYDASAGDVLHDVTLTVEPGEQVAVVGTTGAGKSTLAALAAGIQRPTAGRVRLGGRSPDELGAAAWRRHVVLVTQDVHVFAGTLADDLRLADPAATDVQLRDALVRVGADWVERLAQGLQTVVGDGGHRLTAVQAQQLALARVVLVDPPVLLLDEATAEAGSTSAGDLEAAAAAAARDRSVLIIAHRLSHAAGADRIAVVDSGRITELGTHDELVAGGGSYAELWRTWSESLAEGDASR